MAEPKTMYCATCKGDKAHKPLSQAEQAWLRKNSGEKYVGGYFLCTEEGCRHPRTTFKKNPFADAFRIPDLD